MKDVFPESQDQKYGSALYTGTHYTQVRIIHGARCARVRIIHGKVRCSAVVTVLCCTSDSQTLLVSAEIVGPLFFNLYPERFTKPPIFPPPLHM